MQAYHVQTTVAKDGSLKLNNLPFPAGELVEVIILTRLRLCRARIRIRCVARR